MTEQSSNQSPAKSPYLENLIVPDSSSWPTFSNRFFWFCLILVGLVAVMDREVAFWVYDEHFKVAIRNAAWSRYIKWPGDFRFTLVVGALILIVNYRRLLQVIQLLVAGIMSGLVYTMVKWIVGRTRPFPLDFPYVQPFDFHPFPKGIVGLWKAGNMAFPSGHTCLAFATAASLAAIAPRGTFVYYAIAMIVGIERVMEGAHYPSDVAGGMMFGVLSAALAGKLVRKYVPPVK